MNNLIFTILYSFFLSLSLFLHFFHMKFYPNPRSNVPHFYFKSDVGTSKIFQPKEPAEEYVLVSGKWPALVINRESLLISHLQITERKLQKSIQNSIVVISFVSKILMRMVMWIIKYLLIVRQELCDMIPFLPGYPFFLSFLLSACATFRCMTCVVSLNPTFRRPHVWFCALLLLS